MLSSRGCLRLLLGWALLLGHTVGGIDSSSGEAGTGGHLAASEGAAEAEAEDELPSSSEGAAEADDLETSEEAPDESYHDDDIWFMDSWSASEEQVEKVASLERAILEQPGNFYTRNMRESCMFAMNKDSQGPFYKLLEDADLHVKKAIGSVSTFSLFVGTTNCSRAEGVKSHFSPHFYDLWHRRRSQDNPSRPKCTLEPDSSIQKCKIYVYTDGETGASSVFHTECEYFMMEDEEPQAPLE